jgi:hypothetical protein
MQKDRRGVPFHVEINITTSIFALVIGILMSDNTTVRVEHHVLVGRMAL